MKRILLSLIITVWGVGFAMGQTAPSGADNTVTINEDTDYVFQVADFGFDDGVEGNSFVSINIVTSVTVGTLYNDANIDGIVDGGEELTDASSVTEADISADRLKFKPLSDGNGSNYDSFIFQVVDNGTSDNTSGNYTMTIDVTPVNDVPVITNLDASLGSGFTEEGASVIIDADVAYTDVEFDAVPDDYDGAVITIRRDGGTGVSDDVFGFNDNGSYALNAGNIESSSTPIASFTLTSGELVINFDKSQGVTQANVNAILQNVTYSNSNDDPPTSVDIDFIPSDGTDTGTEQTISIAITATNDAPVIAELDGDAITYTFGQGAAVLDTGMDPSLSDVDNPADLNGYVLNVTISANEDAGNDVLSVENVGTGTGEIDLLVSDVSYEGATIGTIDGNNNGENGILTIMFNASATLPSAGAVLNHITFATSGTSELQRTIDFVVNDGTDDSNTASTTVDFNSHPIITFPGAQSITDEQTLTLSTGNSNVISIADSDTDDQTVTLSVGSGILNLASTAGLTSHTGDGTSSITIEGSLSNINTALDGLEFDPENIPGTYTISMDTDDRNGGSDNETVTISVNTSLEITEIMYDPKTDDDWEWIEIYNGASFPYDLTGYVLDDNNGIAHGSANIASGSIAAGSYAILYNEDDIDNTDFEAAWGAGATLIGVTNWNALALNNSSDQIGLWTNFTDYSGDNVAHSNAIISFSYPNNGSDGVSIYLNNLSDDPSVLGNWSASADGVPTDVNTGKLSVALGGNAGGEIASPGGNNIPTSQGVNVIAGVEQIVTISTADFGYSDVDGATFDHVDITTLPGTGTLFFDSDDNDIYAGASSGEEITVGEDVSIADLNSGYLKYIAPSSTGTSTFTFSVNDGTQYSENYTGTLYSVENALDFDGVVDNTNDDFVQLTSASVAISTGTIEAWVRMPDPISGRNAVVIVQQRFGLFLDDNLGVLSSPVVSAFEWGTGTWRRSSVSIDDGDWHHVAFVFDDDVVDGSYLYVDGQEVLNFTYNSSGSMPTNDLLIGGRYGTLQNLNGQIDEVRIWDDVRSSQEIRGNANSRLTGTEDNLLIYYDFNAGVPEGTNTGLNTLPNLSPAGSALDATLNNLSLTSTTSNWVASTAFSSTAATTPEIRISDGVEDIASGGSFTFGAFNIVDGATESQTFTIHNDGLSDLEVTASGDIAVSNTAFTINHGLAFPLTIAPGGNATFDLDWTAAAGTVVSESETVTVNSDDPDEGTYTFTATGYVVENTVDFDGDYATVADNASISPTGNITLEAWIRLDAIGGLEPIISKYAGDGGYALRVSATGNVQFLTLDNSSVFDIVSGTTALSPSIWYHVAGVYDGSSLTVYLNGVQDGNIASTRNPKDGAAALEIGRNPASDYFDGQIEEVRVWSSDRTVEQIRANAASRLANPTAEANLVAYYDFNSGIPSGTNTGETNLNDLSSNGNDATLVGLALTGSTSNWIASTAFSSPAATTPNIAVYEGATLYSDGGAYDFGSQGYGTDTDVVFTIINEGLATLGSLLTTLSTTGDAEFSVFSNAAQTSLAPGASDNFTIRFSPSAVATYTGAIAIPSDDGDEDPYNIDLDGAGVDLTAPTFVAAHFYDIGGSGHINEVVIEMDEPINDGTIEIADFSIGAATFSLGANDGTTGNALDPDVINDKYFTFEITGGYTGTATATVAYDPNGGGTAKLADISTAANEAALNAGITVSDEAAPVITSVSVPANDTYIVGETLDFTVNFSESVTVDDASGTPTIGVTLESGSTTATYNAGSPGTAIDFRYTVATDDEDTDGIALGASISLNTGTIQDGSANDAILTLNSIGTLTSVLVDGVLPEVSATETIDYNGDGTVDYIKITFTEPVSDASVAPADFVASIAGIDPSTDGTLLSESFFSGSPTGGAEDDVANDAVVFVGVASDGETISPDKTDYALKVAVVGTVDDSNGNPSVAETAYHTSTDGAAPLILSQTLAASNAYLDINFSEGLYTSNGTGASLVADWTEDFIQNTGTATNATIDALTTTSDSPLSGGESSIRFVIAWTGSQSGDETIAIRPANGTSVYDAGALNEMDGGETTGNISVNAVTEVTFLSAVTQADNTYITVTFSEPVGQSNNNGIRLDNGSGGNEELVAVFNDPESNVSLSNGSITDNTGAAISGDVSIIRYYFTLTGTPDGNETITFSPFDATEIYSAGGTAMLASESIIANITDKVLPTITSMTYYDTDLDGSVDEVMVTMSENVDDDFITAANFTFGGSTALSVSSSIENTDDPGTTDDNLFTLEVDVVGTGGFTGVYTAGNLVDLAGNAALSNASITTIDKAAPIVLSAETNDNTVNGKIDQILVTYSESVTDPGDYSTVFVVTGRSVQSVGTGTSANDNLATITLIENVSVDTDYTPTLDLNSGQVQDTDGNALGVTQNFGIVQDGAAPAIVDAYTYDSDADGNADRMEVQFSEPVSDLSMIDAYDGFSVTDGSGMDNISGFTSSVANLAVDTDNNDQYVTLEWTNANTVGSGIYSISYTNNGEFVEDLSANQNALQDISTPIAAQDGAAPIILSASWYDTNTDGDIDQVTIVFGEAVSLTDNFTDGTADDYFEISDGSMTYPIVAGDHSGGAYTNQTSMTFAIAPYNGTGIDDLTLTYDDGAVGGDINETGGGANELADLTTPNDYIDQAFPQFIEISSSGTDNYYVAGETVTLTVLLSETATVTADLTALNPGFSSTAPLALDGGAPDFTYTVSRAANNMIDGDNLQIKLTATDDAGKVTDDTNNSTAAATSGNDENPIEIFVDKVLPTLTTVSLTSSNANDVFAKNGEEVTLSFTTSEALIVDPTVSMAVNGSAVASGRITLSASGNDYEASFMVDDAIDSDGEVTFAIDFTDEAGNMGTQVTGTTDASGVDVDVELPTLSSVLLSSNNGTNTSYAKAGEVITLSFTASEPLIANPTVVFSTGNPDAITNDGNDYEATYTIQAGDPEGAVTFTIDFTDAAGNIGNQVGSGSGSMTIDKVDPTISSVTDGDDGTYKSGESITLTVDAGETGLDMRADLSVINPTFSSTQQLYDDGSNGDAIVGDGIYTYITSNVDQSNSLQEGTNTAIMVSATDNAGNQDTDNSLTLDFDKTSPTLSISSISDDGYVNASEDDIAVPVVGTSDENGGTVSIVVGGQTYTGNVSGGGWTINIPSAAFGTTINEGTGITLTADISDNAGNAATQATRTFVYDATASITYNATLEGNNIINATEEGDVVIRGTSIGIEDGREVTVNLADPGSVHTTSTSAIINNNTWAASEVNLGSSGANFDEGIVTVTVTVSDLAGNQITNQASTQLTIDRTANIDAITVVSDAGSDNKINGAEAAALSLSGTTTGVQDGASLSITVSDGTTQTTKNVTVNANAWNNGLDLFNIASYQEGPISIQTTVTDAAGNTATLSKSISYDNTATITISTPIEGDGYINNAESDDVVITGTTTGVEDDQEVTVYFTDGSSTSGNYTATVISGSWTINAPYADLSTGYINGVNSITVHASVEDVVGNNPATSTTVTLDQSVTINISATPTGFDANVNASEDNSVGASGTTDAETGRTVTVTFSDGSNSLSKTTTVTAGGNWSVSGVNISGLDDGAGNTITAAVEDIAGNSDSDQVMFELDKTANISIDDILEDDNVINSTEDDEFTISGESGSIQQTRPVNITVSDGSTTYDPGGDETTIQADVDGSWTYTFDLGAESLNPGTLTITVTSSDVAGNEASATKTVTYDPTATIEITTPISDNGSGGDFVNASEDESLIVSGTTSNVQTGQEVTVSFSDGTNTPVISTATVISNAWSASAADISGLDETIIEVSVSVTDQAGNTATDSYNSLTLDKSGSLTITTPIALDDYVNDSEKGSVQIVGSAPGFADTDVLTLTLTDGSSTPITINPIVNGEEWNATITTIPSLLEGTIEVKIEGEDEAGNADEETVSITYDASATIVISTPVEEDDKVSIAESSSVVVTGTTTGVEGGQTVTVTFTDALSNTVTATPSVSGGTFNTGDVNISGLQEGTVTVDVSVEDLAENNPTASTDIELDYTVPDITALTIASNNNDMGSDNAHARDGHVITLTMVFNDDLSAAPIVAFTSGGLAINDATIDYSETSDSPDTWTASYTVNSSDIQGDVDFTVNYSDDAGNTGPSRNASNLAGSTVEVDFTKPTVTFSNNPENPTNTNPFNITATFDEDVTGLEKSDFTVTNGSVASVSPGTGPEDVYTITVDPVGGVNDVELTLNFDAVMDDAGNTNAESDEQVYPYDDVAPVMDYYTTIEGRELTLYMELDEPGTVYYAVVNDGVTVTSADLRDETGNALSAVAYGSISFNSGGDEDDVTIDLDADREDYDLYVVSEDEVDTRNLLATPEKINVKSGGTVITKPGDLTLCLDGNYATLGDIILSETVKSDFGTDGTSFILQLPENFVFNTDEGSASGNSGDLTVSALEYEDDDLLVITYSVSDTTSLDVLTISGLRIRAISFDDDDITDDDDYINGDITGGSESKDMYLANTNETPVFATLATIAPFNVPVIISDIDDAVNDQPYILETESVVLGDVLGDGAVTYDYDDFDGTRSPMTIGARTVGNEIRIYSSDDLSSTPLIKENTVAEFSPTLTNLGLDASDASDVGVNTFWITVTDGNSCESAPTKFSVAIIRFQNTRETSSFSADDQTGTTLRFTYPGGSSASFTSNPALSDFKEDSDFASPPNGEDQGYSVKWSPQVAGAGRDTVKYTLTNAVGESADYWVPLLVNENVQIFADGSIITDGICTAIGTLDVEIFPTSELADLDVDYDGSETPSDPDFYEIRIFDFSSGARGADLTSDLLSSSPTIALGPPTSRSGWELDLAAVETLMGSEYNYDLQVVGYVADEVTKTISELSADEYTVYRNPKVEITNVNDYYCEDDGAFNIEARIESSEGLLIDHDIDDVGYMLYKYDENTSSYVRVKDFTDDENTGANEATSSMNPKDLDDDGDTDEDETGLYRISYTTVGYPTAANCQTTATYDFELLSKPALPVLSNNLTNIGGLIDVDNDGAVDDYLLEFAQGDSIPELVANITGADTIIWYGDQAGLSSLTSSGTNGNTITAETLFGTPTPNASFRVIYFAQRTDVEIDGSEFVGCESDLRTVRIEIRAIPNSPAVDPDQIIATRTNQTNLGTFIVDETDVSATGYIFEYCAASGASATLEDVVINTGLSTLESSESYFTVYDSDATTERFTFSTLPNSTLPNFSGTVSPTIEEELLFDAVTGTSKSFYISRTDFDNVPNSDGAEFNGCESDLRKFTIQVNAIPDVPVDSEFLGGTNAASRHPSSTANQLDYYMCYGDEDQFIQLESPGTTGSIYTWYEDDGTGTGPGAALTAAAFNDRFITLDELEDQTIFDDSVSGVYTYWVTQTTNDNLATDFFGCESDPMKVTITVLPDPSVLSFDANGSKSREVSYCEGDLTGESFAITGNPNATFRYYVADEFRQINGAATALFNGAIDEDGKVDVTTSALLLANATQDQSPYYFLISQTNSIKPNESNFAGCESEVGDMAFLTVNVYDIPNIPTVSGKPGITVYFNEDAVPANGIAINDEEKNDNWEVRWYVDNDEEDDFDSLVHTGAAATATNLGLQGTEGNDFYRFLVTQVQDIDAGVEEFGGCESGAVQVYVFEVPEQPTAFDPNPVCEDLIIDGETIGISYAGLALPESKNASVNIVNQFNWYDGETTSTTFATTTPQAPTTPSPYVRDWKTYLEEFDSLGLGLTDTVYVSQQFTIGTGSNAIVCESARTPVEVIFHPRPEFSVLEEVSACDAQEVTLKVILRNIHANLVDLTWYVNGIEENNKLESGTLSYDPEDPYTAYYTFEPLIELDSGISVEAGNNEFIVYAQDINEPTDLTECIAEIRGVFEIGTTPQPQFRWERITEGNPTTFYFRDVNPTGSQAYGIEHILVEIPELDYSQEIIPADPRQKNQLASHSKTFADAGVYEVNVTFTSTSNCTATISRNVTILDKITVTDEETHDFESGSDGWFRDYTTADGWQTDNPTVASWQLGTESVEYPISEEGQTARDTTRYWVTGLDAAYRASANEWVYSPAFDLTGMSSPTIGFDHARELAFTDGVVLQYSLDDGLSWRTLGDYDPVSDNASGKNWYDVQQLTAQPGQSAYNPSADGWSNNGDGWVNTAHRISTNEDLSQVRFRFALGSTGGTKEDSDRNPLNGFAFDDFRIYNKDKVVLVEQFSDLDNEASKKANVKLAELLEGQNDAIWINYFPDFSGFMNDINARNAKDPGARASYYGISAPPKSVLAGEVVNRTGSINPNDSLEWNINDFRNTALESAGFQINDLVIEGEADEMRISASFMSNIASEEDVELSFRFAIVEKEIHHDTVNNGEPLYNVLRKMLPSSAGFTYVGPLEVGQTDFGYDFTVEWLINKVYDVDQLRVIVFVQQDVGSLSDVKHTVLQAASLDVTPGTKSWDPTRPTGIIDNLSDIIQYSLYPNPADAYVDIQLEQETPTDLQWVLYDQVGREMLRGAVLKGKTGARVPSENLPGGMYLLKLFTDSEEWKPKRVIIMHR